MRRWRKLGTLAFLLLLAAFAWRCGSPFLHYEPAQDACEFGPISNARYRELLDEAKKRARTVWPRLRIYQWQPSLARVQELESGITQRIEDLTGGMTSVFEKLAAMHAVARSLGAYHRGFSSRHAYAPLDVPFGSVPFGYEIDVIKFGSTEPFVRTGRLSLRIGTSTKPAHNDAPGRFRAALLWPRWLHRNPRTADEAREACPPMPSKQWAEAFDTWATQLP